MSDRTLIFDTISKVGQEVVLFAWINSVRSHGKIVFADLRDRSGLIQAVYQGGSYKLGSEYLVKVKGLVKKRPEKMVNPKLETGTVELEIKELEVLSECKELPFPLDTHGMDINEEIRLKYRYLDLRRSRLTKNIRLRAGFLKHAREYLDENGFIEIETPLLTKSTPEGSRDFLVPSRLNPGEFYALPQSPQQYKQLLMVAGFERYYQIARCLRDEDLRADRGFEHTQVDIEMSFMDREEVMAILEGLMIHIYKNLGQRIKEIPFPVYTYEEAMKKYGSDKFDLRTQKDKDENIHAFAWVVDFPFFGKDKEGKWTFTHNPFSNPKEEFIADLLEKRDIGKILTSQYDLVCDGMEVGGGSLRSHDPKVLEAVFEIMGYTKEKIEEQFGHMKEAFLYGAPAHGGCAFGVERQMMIITQEKFLREVVAFPQTSKGRSSVMDAPSRIDISQLNELGLILKKSGLKPSK